MTLVELLILEEEYELQINDILEIARNARNVGAEDIYISSILVRWRYESRNLVVRTNQLLEAKCIEEGFVYLDHSDITTWHLSDDGLHLNVYGHAVLKMNMFRCLFTFNPYLCDFMHLYDKAIL